MRSSASAAIAIAAAIALIACRDREAGPRFRGAGATAPRHGGTLTFSAPANLTTLDPAIAYDEVSAFCLHHVYDTLVGYPATGAPAAELALVPRLASSWTISPDGLTYTFQLRAGVTFSDGAPVTAADYVYAWQRVLRLPASPFPGFLAPIDGAAAYAAGERDDVPGLRAGDGVLEVRLVHPDAAFLYVLAMPFATPVRAAVAAAHDNDLRRTVVGTGAFVVEAWREGEELVLARNPRHWDAPRPYLDRVVFRENLPRDSAYLHFLRGELDVVDRLPATAWLAIRGARAWQPYLRVAPQLSTFGARMDVRRPPFDDVRVRRALNYALDHGAQVRALHGLAVPAHGLLPPGMLGRDDTLAPYPHDVARARALLAEAGHPDGLDLEYVTVDEEYAVRLAQLLQADLAEAGVRVKLSVLAWSTFLEATAAPDGPPFSYTSWLMDYPDPSNFLDVRFHSRQVGATNDSGYANPALDWLLDLARGTTDPAERAARYREAERLLFDDAPWIWGYHPQIAEVVQPYVRDVAPHPVWVHDFTAAWLDLDAHGQKVAPVIRRIVRRVVGLAAVAVVTVSAAFLLVIALPADPARVLIGPHASAATLARVRAHYCLDRGLAARYGCFVGRIGRGDLGRSLRSGRPVAELIGERAAATAQLALAALVLQLALSVPLAVGAARRRARGGGRLAEAAITIAQSTPAFVLGPLLLYLVGYRLGWLPLGGRGDGTVDRLRHLALPALTLAITGLATQVRVLRDELATALASDHVRAARARGLSERAVVWRHALRPALAPFLAVVGVDLGALLGGAVVVESIFAWPGLGRETVQAVATLDVPVLLGVALCAALAVGVANLAADLVTAWIDPRARDA